MEYLKLFENHSQYEDFIETEDFVRPNVSHCIEQEEVHYNPIIHDYSKDYLTFVALEDNTSFGFTDRLSNYQLSYSLDNGSTWTVLEGDNTVTINTNEKILWKGELIPTRVVVDPSNIGVFTSTKHFNAMGNIMSLAYSDDFVENNTLPESIDFFKKLFMESNIVDAGNLVLPAMVLTNECYTNMFAGCTSLTVAPELPATTLAPWCYNSMFGGCTSLTTAPELSATTLAEGCYRYMFENCISLVNAPELPSLTLQAECYYSMFKGCTNLITAPELKAETLYNWSYMDMFNGCTNLTSITCLATDISANNCTTRWVNGVAANGIFTKASSMNNWTTGNSGIPTGWTVETAN